MGADFPAASCLHAAGCQAKLVGWRQKLVLNRRFAATLQELQRDSGDCSLTRLNDCNIYDAKTRKATSVPTLSLAAAQVAPNHGMLIPVTTLQIAEAMRNSKELTCLDLSSNHIGDAGIEVCRLASLYYHNFSHYHPQMCAFLTQSRQMLATCTYQGFVQNCLLVISHRVHC